MDLTNHNQEPLIFHNTYVSPSPDSAEKEQVRHLLNMLSRSEVAATHATLPRDVVQGSLGTVLVSFAVHSQYSSDERTTGHAYLRTSDKANSHLKTRHIHMAPYTTMEDRTLCHDGTAMKAVGVEFVIW